MIDTLDVGPAGKHFAEAVALLARLPPTDIERAEAVRRRLASDRTPAVSMKNRSAANDA